MALCKTLNELLQLRPLLYINENIFEGSVKFSTSATFGAVFGGIRKLCLMGLVL